MSEIWKDIEGFEGFYKISSFGRVLSLARLVRDSKKGNLITFKERFISQNAKKIGKGYIAVRLRRPGVDKAFFVHRLVAIHFIPNPNHKNTVNHIDGNSRNNRVENLEWCTQQENIQHAFKTGLVDIMKRRKDAKTSFKIIQMTIDGEPIREWPSLREAHRNGYHATCIGYCLKGRLKTHAGFQWKRAI